VTIVKDKLVYISENSKDSEDLPQKERKGNG
jgi:hypothetical protein